MKTPQKPAISKIIARIDNELMNIIMEDLKSVRVAKKCFMRLIKTEQLSVA
ncbi:MAG: hypothetical protein ACXVAY_22425 [Mucilaginibacter sp.]